MKSLGLLLIVSVLAWMALLFPGWLLWGEMALVHSAAAWALCVLPGVAATAWALHGEQSSEARVLAVLAGSGIRLAFTLGGGLLLTEMLPEIFTRLFWLWVGLFYILLLSLEVLVLVRHQPGSTSVG